MTDKLDKEDGKDEEIRGLEKKIDDYEGKLSSWSDSLIELSTIKGAIERLDIKSKIILDVGTDCVKTLYLAIKYKPKTIVGITDSLSSIDNLDIEQRTRLLFNTNLKFYECNLFNETRLKGILEKEEIKEFDLILLSKTLHHLRTGECIAKENDKNHICKEDPCSCVYKFETKEVFDLLLSLGKKVVVFECFYCDDDEDKEDGRGGYLRNEEWKEILDILKENYKGEIIEPTRVTFKNLDAGKIVNKLKRVDCICFYVKREDSE